MLSWVKLTISSYEEAPTTWQLVQIPTVSVCLSAGKALFISRPISDSHLERGPVRMASLNLPRKWLDGDAAHAALHISVCFGSQ